MEIRIEENRIFKITRAVPCETIQEGLMQTLSEQDRIFARYEIRNGYYCWAFPDGPWTALSEADDLDCAAVNAALATHRESVKKTLGRTDNLVDNIFTVPDDSFIFYQVEPGGGIRLMLTGWDYKYPVSPTAMAGGDRDRKKTRQMVVVSFKEGSVGVPKYEFSVKTPAGRDKSFTCDEQGRCVLGTLPPGLKFSIFGISTPHNGELTVVDGQELYEFDVTRVVDVVVKVLTDGLPTPGKGVTVNYRDDEISCTTDLGGCAAVKLPYVRDTFVAVTVGDQMRSSQIQLGDNVFEFVFETPPPPVPEEPQPQKGPEPAGKREFAPRILVLGQDDCLLKRFPLLVEMNGRRVRYISDNTAKVYLPPVTEGTSMTLISELSEKDRCEYVLSADQEEYVFRVPYKMTDSDNDIEIRVVDGKDRPITNASINFEQDGHSTRCYLEEDGIVMISSSDFRCGVPIRTVLTAFDKEYETLDFQLTEGEKSYIIQVEKPSKPWLKWVQVLVLVILAALLYLLMNFYLGILL